MRMPDGPYPRTLWVFHISLSQDSAPPAGLDSASPSPSTSSVVSSNQYSHLRLV